MNWKLILKIVSWFTPVIVGFFVFYANHKITKYEQAIKLKINKNKKKDIYRNIQKWKYFGWGAIPLGSLFLLIAQTQINRIDESKYIEEKLKSALNGTLKNPETSNNSRSLKIIVGSDELIYEITNNGEMVVRPLKMYDLDYPLYIKFSNGKLKVSADINSFDGKIVSKIIDNNWEINPNNYFKRNYDDFGLEIIDAYGNPILQLEMIDQNTLRIAGLFYYNRLLYIITKSGIIMNTTTIEDIPNLVKEYNVPEMYVYPAEEHFGERKK